MASTLIYLKLTAAGKVIAGESVARGYEGQIEIESIDWGIDAQHKQSPQTKKTTTELRPKRVILTKHFDKASTNLCQLLDKTPRKPYDSAKLIMLSMTMSGNEARNVPLMEMLLTDGFVEEVKENASGSGKAVAVKETVTLSFRKMKLMYFPPDIKSAGRSAPTTLDLEQPSVGS